MNDSIVLIVKEHALAIGIGVLYYVGAGIIAVIFARKTRIDRWCAANPRLALVLNFLRATGFDVWKILASLQTLVRSRAGLPPVLPGVMFMLTFVSGIVLGCAYLPGSKTVYQEWRAVCGKEMALRPEVASEARARKLSVGDFAEAICELSDVVAPFVRTTQGPRKLTPPSEEAVEAARRLGMIR
jgi:hypothetical protein